MYNGLVKKSFGNAAKHQKRAWTLEKNIAKNATHANTGKQQKMKKKKT